MRRFGDLVLLYVEDLMEAFEMSMGEVVSMLESGEIGGKKVKDTWIITIESLTDFLKPKTMFKEVENNPRDKTTESYDIKIDYLKVFPHSKDVDVCKKLERIKSGEEYILGKSTSIGRISKGLKVLFRSKDMIVGEGVVLVGNEDLRVNIQFEPESVIIYSSSIPIVEFLDIEGKRDHRRAHLKLKLSTYQEVMGRN